MKPFWILTAAIVVVAGPALADDLTGADLILCSSSQATACSAEGGCESAPPQTWNIPLFIEIDLTAKTLGTTEASGENRTTPIKNLERNEGRIVLQGYERGRAFSFVIDEPSGLATVAVARDGLTVSVFGACTPLSR
jgi:hypothetical protein